MNKNGAVVLYDIYFDAPDQGERWIGSRRTKEQCRQSFQAYFVLWSKMMRPPTEAALQAIVPKRFQYGVAQQFRIALALPRQLNNSLGDQHDGGMLPIVHAQG